MVSNFAVTDFGCDPRPDLTAAVLTDDALIGDIANRLGKPLNSEETCLFLAGTPIGKFQFGSRFGIRKIEDLQIPFHRGEKGSLAISSKLPEADV